MDSECNLIADAGADPVRAECGRIRNRLLGEQLGLPPDVGDTEDARLGSMGALIDARADANRTLLPVDMTPPETPAEAVKAAANTRRTARPRRGNRGAAAAGRPRGSQRLPSASGRLRRHRDAADHRASAVGWRRGHHTGIEHVAVAVGNLDRPCRRGRGARALVPLELLAILAGVALGWDVGGGPPSPVGGWAP